jgi:hypothetical protein
MCLSHCHHTNPWLHVTLALEYMEHVVTTMSEISAVMTGRKCSRGLEIWLMLVCKKCKVIFCKEGVFSIKIGNLVTFVTAINTSSLHSNIAVCTETIRIHSNTTVLISKQKILWINTIRLQSTP